MKTQKNSLALPGFPLPRRSASNHNQSLRSRLYLDHRPLVSLSHRSFQFLNPANPQAAGDSLVDKS